MDTRSAEADTTASPRVPTSHPSIWRRMFAFAGPAYLVSVGYMDPGNWATDLEGGARFGYGLLWVLVASNLMALLLQTLSARLGIVSGRDLAQACREAYPRPISLALWVLCEVAIAACDLAELLGAAIGLNLLFGLPLIWGVLLSASDTLALLWFDRFGIRLVETIILGFISIIAGCFFIELLLARPDPAAIARGLIPQLNQHSLYVAIAILGATVMPHNLYLHSSLVQTRQIGVDARSKRSACRYNLVDSLVALNGALLVNAAILIVAAATFFQHGIVVTEIQQAHQLLAPLLGTSLAGVVFAVALICSGQSSTITGTMAGQIVMEGFLSFRMRPWLRRFLTRALAVAPAAWVVWQNGDQGAYQLLIFSQVVLSLQLPFAVVPLVRFTSSRGLMGEFASPMWVKLLSWGAGGLIVGLNLWLALSVMREWSLLISLPLALLLLGLLATVVFSPLRQGEPLHLPQANLGGVEVPAYRSILVPLDHTRLDRIALAHAAALGGPHKATLHLLHVEDDMASQIYGDDTQTAHITAGRAYLEQLAESVRALGLDTRLSVVRASAAKTRIVATARELRPDLIVMGAHGHKGLRDIVLGETINEVRHAVAVPVLVVRDPADSGPA